VADAIPLLLEYEDIHSKLEHVLQTKAGEIKELIRAGSVTGGGRERRTSRSIAGSLRDFLNWVKRKIDLAD
jgi:hypothetical protein